MNHEAIQKVADAVLYEGYMLYPYRPSALKNQQRWMFGILYPPEYQEVKAGTERSTLHAECLLIAANNSVLNLRLRFLHARKRQVMAAVCEQWKPMQSLIVDGEVVESWEECVERSIDVDLKGEAGAAAKRDFGFSGSCESLPLREKGRTLGRLDVIQHAISGVIGVTVQQLDNSACKIAIDVANLISFPTEATTRSEALLRSLLSAHLIITVKSGQFISLLEPPAQFRAEAEGCRNIGVHPFLIGDPEQRDTVLCSPIMLYDYPQVAPESAGDFFDATEMDEMLTLRVLTLSNEEKAQIMQSDERARSLLERTEMTAREQLRRTHGAIRSLRPVEERK